MPHTFKNATITDMPGVAKLLVMVWKSCYQSFLPAAFLESLSEEHQTKRHQRIFQSGAHYQLCENEKKELIGFCSYGSPRSSDLLSDLEIYTLYVHPDYQRQGIGKALLSVIENNTKHSLSVIVIEENPFLIFYLKHGYKRESLMDLDLGLTSVKAGVYLKEIK